MTGYLTSTRIGGYKLTQSAETWYEFFRPVCSAWGAASEQSFQRAILRRAHELAPKTMTRIGGNAVLRAAADLGLYNDRLP